MPTWPFPYKNCGPLEIKFCSLICALEKIYQISLGHIVFILLNYPYLNNGIMRTKMLKLYTFDCQYLSIYYILGRYPYSILSDPQRYVLIH